MLSPVKRFQLGKKGLTQEFIEQMRGVFKHENVIKVEILKSACRDKEEAKKIGDDLVNALGSNFTYKLIGYVLTVQKWRKDKR